MRLADYVFKFLKDYGVKHVFMLSGGGAMYLDDALGKSGIKYTCNLHEQACAIAASAYAQYTNDLGVCLVTTAPGGTNTITGVAGAWLDSIPMLIISGQVKRADLRDGGLRQRGLQELNVVDIARPITKYAEIVTQPEDILYHLEKAINYAKSNRPAPVWLDIPLDVQSAEINTFRLEEYLCKNSKQQYPYLKREVDRAIELINNSKRPMIIAGNGIRLSGGYNDFLKLIDSLNIPIITTWKAADFLSEDHPLFIGRSGIIGQQGANISQQSADLILSIGARLDFGQIGYDQSKFAPKAKKIIVDVDYAEINKLKEVDVRIYADAKEFIEELTKQSIEYKDNGWLAQCKELQAKYPVTLPEYYKEKDVINTYAFINELSKVLKENDLIIPSSSGSAAEITMQAFKVKKGQRIFNTEGLGSMGFGIASAIGGCIASGRRTICIEGDGSFAMNTQELETIRRLQLPIKIFVLNNLGYASVRNTQNAYFNGYLVGCDRGSGVSLPNIQSIANAYGLEYFPMNDNRTLDYYLNYYLNKTKDRPCVIEVKVNPMQKTVPKVISKLNSNGTYEQNDFKDMSY